MSSLDSQMQGGFSKSILQVNFSPPPQQQVNHLRLAETRREMERRVSVQACPIDIRSSLEQIFDDIRTTMLCREVQRGNSVGGSSVHIRAPRN